MAEENQVDPRVLALEARFEKLLLDYQELAEDTATLKACFIAEGRGPKSAREWHQSTTAEWCPLERFWMRLVNAEDLAKIHNQVDHPFYDSIGQAAIEGYLDAQDQAGEVA